jgi:hypothetical protein
MRTSCRYATLINMVKIICLRIDCRYPNIIEMVKIDCLRIDYRYLTINEMVKVECLRTRLKKKRKESCYSSWVFDNKK